MKMKRISAATIQDALAVARRELGEDAVLLESKKLGRGKGVVVTFAVDQDDSPLFGDAFDEPSPLRAFNPDPPLREAPIPRAATPKLEIDHPALALIDKALAYHALPDALSARIRQQLGRVVLTPDSLIEVAHTALAKALELCLAFQPIATASTAYPARALMLVGPHGAGKTSVIVKLASELALHKKPVVIISTDLERLGGTENLQTVASITGSAFHICETRNELKPLLAQYAGKAWVLIDSTGANIYEFKQMKALGELASLQGIEPILTCPAGMDVHEASEMAGVFDFLAIERMIVTRLDATRRLSSVFTMLTTGGYALSNLSNSAHPADSCQPLSPIALARFMLRHEREKITP